MFLNTLTRTILNEFGGFCFLVYKKCNSECLLPSRWHAKAIDKHVFYFFLQTKYNITTVTQPVLPIAVLLRSFIPNWFSITCLVSLVHQKSSRVEVSRGIRRLRIVGTCCLREFSAIANLTERNLLPLLDFHEATGELERVSSLDFDFSIVKSNEENVEMHLQTWVPESVAEVLFCQSLSTGSLWCFAGSRWLCCSAPVPVPLPDSRRIGKRSKGKKSLIHWPEVEWCGYCWVYVSPLLFFLMWSVYKCSRQITVWRALFFTDACFWPHRLGRPDQLGPKLWGGFVQDGSKVRLWVVWWGPVARKRVQTEEPH